MSFLEPRIGLKQLANLSRRLSTSLSAGVDVRAVFAREAGGARGLGASRFEAMQHEVAGGSTVSDALAKTGNYFPKFFRELVRVGEDSGHLSEVLRQLAEHYEHQLKMRRTLLAALAWPMLELTMALGVVGVLIWAMGISQLADQKVDLLGFGLTGNSGLMKYLGFLTTAAIGAIIVYRATTRGMLWVAPVQRAIMSIPKLGRTLETLALARMAWALQVTLNSGMDVRRALTMSLESTNNVIYTRHISRVQNEIRKGHEISEALASTRAFPVDFLATVQVGEESGRLVESMEHLAHQYQDQARLAMTTLTILLGFGVAMMVAGMIIFLIFRIAGFYFNTLNDALNMKI